MSQENDDIKRNIVHALRSTFMDPDYNMGGLWKPPCFITPVSQNGPVEYEAKKQEMLQKGHNIQETYCFLLLTGPNHDSKASNTWACRISPSENLGKKGDGVVLFKSIDVLLRFAASERINNPMMAIYKVIPGRQKVQLCDLQNIWLDYEPPDPDYDSKTLELQNQSDLACIGVKYQLLASEILLYDFCGRTMCYQKPRQAYLVTILSFLPVMNINQGMVPLPQHRFQVDSQMSKGRQVYQHPQQHNVSPSPGDTGYPIIPVTFGSGEIQLQCPSNMNPRSLHEFQSPLIRVLSSRNSPTPSNSFSPLNNTGKVDILAKAAIDSGLPVVNELNANPMIPASTNFATPPKRGRRRPSKRGKQHFPVLPPATHGQQHIEAAAVITRGKFGLMPPSHQRQQQPTSTTIDGSMWSDVPYTGNQYQLVTSTATDSPMTNRGQQQQQQTNSFTTHNACTDATAGLCTLSDGSNIVIGSGSNAYVVVNSTDNSFSNASLIPVSGTNFSNLLYSQAAGQSTSTITPPLSVGTSTFVTLTQTAATQAQPGVNQYITMPSNVANTPHTVETQSQNAETTLTNLMFSQSASQSTPTINNPPQSSCGGIYVTSASNPTSQVQSGANEYITVPSPNIANTNVTFTSTVDDTTSAMIHADEFTFESGSMMESLMMDQPSRQENMNATSPSVTDDVVKGVSSTQPNNAVSTSKSEITASSMVQNAASTSTVAQPESLNIILKNALAELSEDGSPASTLALAESRSNLSSGVDSPVSTLCLAEHSINILSEIESPTDISVARNESSVNDHPNSIVEDEETFFMLQNATSNSFQYRANTPACVRKNGNYIVDNIKVESSILPTVGNTSSMSSMHQSTANTSSIVKTVIANGSNASSIVDNAATVSFGIASHQYIIQNATSNSSVVENEVNATSVAVDTADVSSTVRNNVLPFMAQNTVSTPSLVQNTTCASPLAQNTNCASSVTQNTPNASSLTQNTPNASSLAQNTTSSSSLTQNTTGASSVAQIKTCTSLAQHTPCALSLAQNTTCASSLSQNTTCTSSLTQNATCTSSLTQNATCASSLVQNTTSISSLTQNTTCASSVAENTTCASSLDENTTYTSSVAQNTTSASSLTQNANCDSSLTQNTTSASSVTQNATSALFLTQNTTSASSFAQNTTCASSLALNTTSASSLAQNTTCASSLTQNATSVSSLAQIKSCNSSSLVENTVKASSMAENATSNSFLVQNTTDASSLAQNTTSASSLAKNTTIVSSLTQNTTSASSLDQNTTCASSLAQNATSSSSLAQNTTSVSSLTQNTTSSSSLDQNTTCASSLAQNATSSSSLAQNTTSASSLDQNTTCASSLAQNTTNASSLVQNATSISSLDQNTTCASSLAQNATSSSSLAQNTTSVSSLTQNTTSASSLDQNTTSASSLDQNTTSSSSLAQNTTSASSLVQNTTSASSLDQNTTCASSLAQNTTSASSLVQNTTSASSLAQNTTCASSLDQNTTCASSLDQNTTSASSLDQNTTSASSLDQNTTSASSLAQNTTSISSLDQNTTCASSLAQNATSASSLDQNTTSSSSLDQNTTSASSLAQNTTCASSLDQNTTSSSSLAQNATCASSLDQNTTCASSLAQNTTCTSSLAENTTCASSLAENTTDDSSAVAIMTNVASESPTSCSSVLHGIRLPSLYNDIIDAWAMSSHKRKDESSFTANLEQPGELATNSNLSRQVATSSVVNTDATIYNLEVIEDATQSSENDDVTVMVNCDEAVSEDVLESADSDDEMKIAKKVRTRGMLSRKYSKRAAVVVLHEESKKNRNFIAITKKQRRRSREVWRQFASQRLTRSKVKAPVDEAKREDAVSPARSDQPSASRAVSLITSDSVSSLQRPLSTELHPYKASVVISRRVVSIDRRLALRLLDMLKESGELIKQCARLFKPNTMARSSIDASPRFVCGEPSQLCLTSSTSKVIELPVIEEAPASNDATHTTTTTTIVPDTPAVENYQRSIFSPTNSQCSATEEIPSPMSGVSLLVPVLAQNSRDSFEDKLIEIMSKQDDLTVEEECSQVARIMNLVEDDTFAKELAQAADSSASNVKSRARKVKMNERVQAARHNRVEEVGQSKCSSSNDDSKLPAVEKSQLKDANISPMLKRKLDAAGSSEKKSKSKLSKTPDSNFNSIEEKQAAAENEIVKAVKEGTARKRIARLKVDKKMPLIKTIELPLIAPKPTPPPRARTKTKSEPSASKRKTTPSSSQKKGKASSNKKNRQSDVVGVTSKRLPSFEPPDTTQPIENHSRLAAGGSGPSKTSLKRLNSSSSSRVSKDARSHHKKARSNSTRPKTSRDVSVQTERDHDYEQFLEWRRSQQPAAAAKPKSVFEMSRIPKLDHSKSHNISSCRDKLNTPTHKPVNAPSPASSSTFKSRKEQVKSRKRKKSVDSSGISSPPTLGKLKIVKSSCNNTYYIAGAEGKTDSSPVREASTTKAESVKTPACAPPPVVPLIDVVNDDVGTCSRLSPSPPPPPVVTPYNIPPPTPHSHKHVDFKRVLWKPDFEEAARVSRELYEEALQVSNSKVPVDNDVAWQQQQPGRVQSRKSNLPNPLSPPEKNDSGVLSSRVAGSSHPVVWDHSSGHQQPSSQQTTCYHKQPISSTEVSPAVNVLSNYRVQLLMCRSPKSFHGSDASLTPVSDDEIPLGLSPLHFASNNNNNSSASHSGLSSSAEQFSPATAPSSGNDIAVDHNSRERFNCPTQNLPTNAFPSSSLDVNRRQQQQSFEEKPELTKKFTGRKALLPSPALPPTPLMSSVYRARTEKQVKQNNNIPARRNMTCGFPWRHRSGGADDCKDVDPKPKARAASGLKGLNCEIDL